MATQSDQPMAVAPLTLVADVRVHFALRAPRVPSWFEPRLPVRPVAPARPAGRKVNELIDRLVDSDDDAAVLRDYSEADRAAAQAFLRDSNAFTTANTTWLQLRTQEVLAQWPWFYAELVMARAGLTVRETPAPELAPRERTERPMTPALRAAMASPPLTPTVVPPESVTGPDGQSLVADIECANCPWEGPSWSIEKDGVLGPCPRCQSTQLRRKGA